MNNPVFKFTDATNSVVSRTLPDGRCESYSVAAEEYQKWVAAGNAPKPADPIPETIFAPTLVEQILASPADLAALKKALGL